MIFEYLWLAFAILACVSIVAAGPLTAEALGTKPTKTFKISCLFSWSIFVISLFCAVYGWNLLYLGK